VGVTYFRSVGVTYFIITYFITYFILFHPHLFHPPKTVSPVEDSLCLRSPHWRDSSA